MFIAILFVFSLFGAQLVRIQALDASTMAEQALGSRLHKSVVPALRGDIVDSKGVILAASIERYDITVNQQAVKSYVKPVKEGDTTVRRTVGVAGAAADLAPLLGMSVQEVTDKLTGTRPFNYVAKGITPLTWRKIKALGVNGIDAEATSKRSYPTSTTAASLVGFVGADGRPGGGLELLLDKQLQGRPGVTRYEQSRDGRVIPTDSQHSTPAVNGRDVRLTLNGDLQWFAQNAISAKVKETQALSGTVTVTEARTGKLLAVASYPTFDPNNLAQASGNLDNRAFDEVYEPGSTGKVITAAAALQEGVATPDTPVTVPNTLKRAGTVFHDSHDHPTEHLTFAEVLAQSSNLGTMLVGERLEPAKMYGYLRKFGLGEKSGIGFPGETPGLVAKPSDWSGSQRFTMMFGQGLSLNAIQAAGVFQTIANDGVRKPPTLVAGSENADGTYTAAPAPKGVRVISPEVARQVREMLEGVVGKEGTAPEAKIPGYRVAGKTGTADRYDDKTGGYSGKTASFIGFAPADKPELVVGVTLQRPVKSYFGGVVAGPVFHDVMTYALQALKIPPTAATTPPTIKLKTTER
jgi:cell division protein FtsI (penicillin-binding protein 3)